MVSLPALDGTEDALNVIIKAIEAAGYVPGKDVTIGLDVASSEFYKDGLYDYTWKQGADAPKYTSQQQAGISRKGLVEKYPIDSIEDGMAEGDWEGWKILTDMIGDRCQLVGDDLFVTNVKYFSRRVSNSVALTLFLLRLTRSVHSPKLSAQLSSLSATATPQSSLTVQARLRTLLSPTSLLPPTPDRLRPVLQAVLTVWPSTTSSSASRKNSAKLLLTAMAKRPKCPRLNRLTA